LVYIAPKCSIGFDTTEKKWIYKWKGIPQKILKRIPPELLFKDIKNNLKEIFMNGLEPLQV